MTDFLLRIEQSGLCTWVRDSPSILAYPTVLLLHTIGMAGLVAVSAGIDLRILGFAPALPLKPMEKFLPIVWIGFWMNVVTGTVLVAIDATTKLANPDFYVKMAFVALAIINLRLLKTRVFRDPFADKKPLPTNAKILAITSLIFWNGAITAGRLLAYVGPGSSGSK
jgi:hypothetical protein